MKGRAMDQAIVNIFKKTVNDDATAKNDVIDYLVENGGKNSTRGFARDQSIRIDSGHSIMADEYCKIACLLANNRKIPAIKMFREITGCGLRVAKDAVEARINWPI